MSSSFSPRDRTRSHANSKTCMLYPQTNVTVNRHKRLEPIILAPYGNPHHPPVASISSAIELFSRACNMTWESGSTEGAPSAAASRVRDISCTSTARLVADCSGSSEWQEGCAHVSRRQLMFGKACQECQEDGMFSCTSSPDNSAATSEARQGWSAPAESIALSAVCATQPPTTACKFEETSRSQCSPPSDQISLRASAATRRLQAAPALPAAA